MCIRDSAEGTGGCTRELREVARCIVPAPSKGQPFFYDGARNLFVGISLALIEGPSIPNEEKTVMSVAAAISPSGEKGALERVAALAASPVSYTHLLGARLPRLLRRACRGHRRGLRQNHVRT